MALPQFVSIAGIDGSGKSTQTAAVARTLGNRGVDVETSKTRLSATYSIFALSEKLFGDPYAYHPDVPATLREFVVACDVLQHYRSTVEPRLSAGRMILWDRGPLCYEAYARAYGADMEWVLPMLRMVGRPDITFLLDLEADIAWERIYTRTEKPMQTNEELDFLKTFREQYRTLARQTPNVVVLDATRPTEDLTEEIVGRLMRARS